MTHRGAALFFDQPIDVQYTSRWLEKENPEANQTLLRLRDRKGAEAGWRSTNLTVCDLIITLGESYGVDGYVAPANRPEVMADFRKTPSRFVLAPGVGRQGGRIEDVYRTLGARSAAAVGHSLFGADDPAAACRDLIRARESVSK